MVLQPKVKPGWHYSLTILPPPSIRGHCTTDFTFHPRRNVGSRVRGTEPYA